MLIHDNFIMHHGIGIYGDLEEVMRRAFYERFNKHISLSRDLMYSINQIFPLDKDGFVSLKIEDMSNAEN